MTEPELVATAWTSAGNTSPMRVPPTSPVPITERVAAVADAGYLGLGLITDDVAAIRASIGFAGLRDLIADAGLTHIEIELIERWWIPRCEPGHTYDVRDLLFEAAGVLAPAFPPLPLTPQLRPLAIETMPFSIITTVPMGAEIVSAADHPAAGLLVDAWHVFRAGTPLGELRDSLTREMIFGVELNDVAPAVVGTLFEDTVNNRLLCGQGAFDLDGLVTLLRDLEFDGPWGVEILSTSFRALPVREALEIAAKSALAVL